MDIIKTYDEIKKAINSLVESEMIIYNEVISSENVENSINTDIDTLVKKYAKCNKTKDINNAIQGLVSLLFVTCFFC